MKKQLMRRTRAALIAIALFAVNRYGVEAACTIGPNNGINGTYSCITAGDYNQVDGDNCLIGSGIDHYIGPGGMNFIGGGDGNLITFSTAQWEQLCAIGGGDGNSITNNYQSFIGGGSGNSIAGDDASLSAIGGGLANLITEEYSFIGGGYNNSATGYNATISGGYRNGAGDYATVAGGFYNTARVYVSTVGGGGLNVAEGQYSTIAGGHVNHATGERSTIPGGYGALADLYGQFAHGSGNFGTQGSAQTSVYIVRSTTTNASTAELFLDGSAARMVLRTNSTWTFDITVSVRSANGDSAGFRTNGVIKDVSGTVSLVGTGGSISAPAVAADSNLNAATVTISADTGNRALGVTVNGNSAANRWVATVRTTEVQY